MAYVRKRGDTWSYTIDLGKDPFTGKRKQQTVSGFMDDKTAKRAAVQAELEVEQGKNTDNTTVEKYIELFFSKSFKSHLSDSSYINQWQWAKDYIIPKLGKIKIDKVTYTHIEDFYADMINDDVSRGVIKNVAMVLKKIFKNAEIRKYVTSNVARLVKVPTYKPKRAKVWSKEDVAKFLNSSQDCFQHNLYVLDLSTGLRIGEALALEWEDIDFKNNTVTVNKTLKHNKVKKLHTKDPKTNNSHRTVKLPSHAMEALQRQKESQLVETNIVFDYLGNYTYPSTAWRTFKADIKSLGMPTITIHGMRHTHATRLLQMGYNARVVAERLGDTIDTVLRTYAHVLPVTENEVSASLEADYKDGKTP